MQKIIKKLGRIFRKIINIYAKKRLQKMPIWDVLQTYSGKTHFPGKHFYKYLKLYTYVKKHKPLAILECGTGISSIVMAHALMENELKTGKTGTIKSMEENPGEYLEKARSIVPENLKKYLEIVQSPKVEDNIYYFTGVRYNEVPKMDYDFVFIDGPTTKSIHDGRELFDFDFIRLVLNSNKPISALVDNRRSSCLVYRQLFGRKKVKFNPISNIGRIKDCSKKNLRKLGQISNNNLLRVK